MDFNFFEPYLNAPVKSNIKRNLFILLFIAAIVLMGLYQWELIEESNRLQTQIEEVDAFMMSEEHQEKREKILVKENYEKALNSTYDSLKATDQQQMESNVVSAALIEKINAEVPENVFLSNMQIIKGAISFTGFAADYESLSQFVFNIRELDEFAEMSIPTVNELEENLSFSVNGIMSKEGQDEN